MSGLVEFLRARLDEDKRRAQRGYYGDTHWKMWTAGAHLAAWRTWRLRFPREQWDAAANDAIADATRDALRERVTAHEADRSARALADVEAKRQIAEIHQVVGGFTDEDMTDLGPGCSECGYSAAYSDRGGWCETLRLLAEPYASHPDYREEWKP